jgi:DNA end-binding protein Ku
VRALKRRSQVAIVTHVTRGDRERLGMLRPLGDALVLNGLLWSDEVRDVERGIAPAAADVDQAELAAALELVDIADLIDHYAQALAELVDAKVHARVLAQPSAPPQREQLVDLVAALQQSVRAARARRGEDLDSEPNGAGPGTLL